MRFLKCIRGAVLLEIGLVLPLIALVLGGMVAVGLIQLGRAPVPRAADYAASALSAAMVGGENLADASLSIWTGVRMTLGRPEGGWRGTMAIFERDSAGWREVFRSDAGLLISPSPRWFVSGGVLFGPAPLDLPNGSRLSVAEIWVSGRSTPFGVLGIFWAGQAIPH